jgi:hypothetical protein
VLKPGLLLLYRSQKAKVDFSYLSTYDLYGPVRNAFDAASIHYEGKWEWVVPMEIESFFGPCEMASSR